MLDSVARGVGRVFRGFCRVFTLYAPALMRLDARRKLASGICFFFLFSLVALHKPLHSRLAAIRGNTSCQSKKQENAGTPGLLELPLGPSATSLHQDPKQFQAVSGRRLYEVLFLEGCQVLWCRRGYLESAICSLKQRPAGLKISSVVP